MNEMLEVLKELNSGKDVVRLNLEVVAKRYGEKIGFRDYSLEYVKEILVKLHFVIDESRNVVVFTQEGLESVLSAYGML